MTGQDTCFICREPSRVERLQNKDAWEVECPRCGLFWITGRLANEFRHGPLPADLQPYLSAATRQATESASFARLEPGNWKALADAHAQTRLREKWKKLLYHLARKTQRFGQWVATDPAKDYPLIDAVSPEEFSSLLAYLSDRQLIKLKPSRAASLTMEGWNLVDPPESPGGISGRCFVAMSFDPSLNEVYELGIKAALVTDCGLPEPVRMDREQHNDNISVRILAEIRLSQFVVADFTFQRPGVYFEAGFAMALGRPVIWTCREDHFRDTHFDTQQFNHIIWKEPSDLRAKLRDRVLATVPI